MSEEFFIKEAISQIKKNNYKLIADKIIQTLQSIRNNQNISSKRLFWELIQNATDVKYENEKISIKIILTKEQLLFMHNGKFFTIKDVLGLLQQVSSKNSQNLEGQTGKFGTGFIGTFLISNIVEVKGIIKINDKDFRQFEMKLDRSETRSEYLAKDIEKTIEAFLNYDKKSGIFKDKKKNYLKNRKETDFDTCFIYHLNDEQKKNSAKEGMEDLNNTIPIALIILNKKIKQITLIDKEKQIEKTFISYSEGDEKKNDITEFTVKTIFKIREHNQFENYIYFLSYLKFDNKSKKEILRLIKEIGKIEEIIVLGKRDTKIPMLYRNFPLIGSNEFHMPFYVDGSNFNPLEARNGIVLNGFMHGNEESKENIFILEEVYNSIIVFIQLILKKYKYLKNTFFLASTKMPIPIVRFDDYANKWFYEKQIFLREKLRDLPLIRMDSNYPLKDLLLPIFNENYNDNFYDVVSNLNIRKKIIPEKEFYHNWFDIIVGENNESKNIRLKDNLFIKSWGVTKNEELGEEEINYIYDEVSLLKDINNCKNIKTLSSKLGKNKSEIIKCLNDFILFLKNNCKYEKILNDYSIIPNRNGDFKTLKVLYSDHKNRIPKEIIEIYDSISKKKLNDELVDIEIKYEIFEENLKDKDFNDISNLLNDYISKKENIEKIKRFVVYPLLSIESNDKQVTEAYKFLSSLHKLNKMKLIISGKMPTYLWTEALSFWFDEYPKEIEKFTNVQELKSNLIDNNIDDDHVLKWMDQYLSFLESDSPNKGFKNLKIFPNQNGKFCTLKTLHYDSGFPEQLKNILKKFTDIDVREILFDKRILAYKSYQQLSEADITNAIESEFKRLKRKKQELENILAKIKNKENAHDNEIENENNKKNNEENEKESGEKSEEESGEKNEEESGGKKDKESGGKNEGESGGKKDEESGGKNEEESGEKNEGESGGKKDEENGGKKDEENGEKNEEESGEKNEEESGEKNEEECDKENDEEKNKDKDTESNEEDIEKIINDLNENNKKLNNMAFELLCLCPKDQSKDIIKKYIETIIAPPRTEEQLSQSPLDYLGFSEVIFNKKDIFKIEYIEINSLNFMIFINYIMEMLCDEIEKAENFENAKNQFYGVNTRDDLEFFLTKIIKFFWDNQNSDYPIKSCIDFETSEKSVFLNMGNKLVSIKNVKLREGFNLCKNEELLLNMCLNKHINKDYRSELINIKLNQNLIDYKYKFKTYTLESICKKIDDAIMNYDQGNEKGNDKYDTDFQELTQEIKKLEFKKEELKEYFPYYWKNRSRISVSCLNDDDADELFSFVNKGNVKKQIEVLKLFNDNPELSEQFNNIDNNKEDFVKGVKFYMNNKNKMNKGADELMSCLNEENMEQQKILNLFKDNPDLFKKFDNIGQNSDDLVKGLNFFINNKNILSKGIDELLNYVDEDNINQQLNLLKFFKGNPELLKQFSNSEELGEDLKKGLNFLINNKVNLSKGGDELLSYLNEGNINQQLKFLKLLKDDPKLKQLFDNIDKNGEDMMKGLNFFVNNKTKISKGLEDLISNINEEKASQQIKVLKAFKDSDTMQHFLKISDGDAKNFFNKLSKNTINVNEQYELIFKKKDKTDNENIIKKKDMLLKDLIEITEYKNINIIFCTNKEVEIKESINHNENELQYNINIK